jgi:hypothetical protein
LADRWRCRPSESGLNAPSVNLRIIDWIWRVRGKLALAPGQSSEDAFDRLDPLFRQTGTSYERTNDTLIFSKKNQAAQDKMSVFDAGELQIDKSVGGSSSLHLTSRTLLFCFLASPLFLGIAQLTTVISNFEKPAPHEEKKHVDSADEPDRQSLGRSRTRQFEERSCRRRSRNSLPRPPIYFRDLRRSICCWTNS